MLYSIGFAGSNTARWGQCLAYANCYMSGGFGEGSCADGYGVCCLFFTTTCATSVNHNISYIQNPGYPSGYSTTASTTCNYYIQKCEDAVCQVRMDFESLSLTDPLRTSTAAGPGAGTCVTDTLTMVTSSGDSFGPICGSETDSSQHIYMDVGTGGSDSVTLSFGTNFKLGQVLEHQSHADPLLD